MTMDIPRRSRRPLVLTGGPAAGKSPTAQWLARHRPRAAYIDADDVRQLVVAGGTAPWKGDEGAAQQLLGARNGCALARNFISEGFDVVLADVLTPMTARIYRIEIPEILIIRLAVEFAEAQRRATMRPVWITNEEFDQLHRDDRDDPPAADLTVDVTAMSADEQHAALELAWAHHGLPRVRNPDPSSREHR